MQRDASQNCQRTERPAQAAASIKSNNRSWPHWMGIRVARQSTQKYNSAGALGAEIGEDLQALLSIARHRQPSPFSAY